MMKESELEKLVVGRKVLIDSNIILYLTDSVQPYAPLTHSLFKIIESGDASGVISLISVSEVMQGPMRSGLYSIASDVRVYLTNFPNCYCQSITPEVLEQIGTDPRIDWRGLRTMDALIIASGIINGVEIFISNDKHFKKSIPQDMLLSFDQ